MANEKKFAGYICTGCGIGNRLNVDQLRQIAIYEGKMPEVKQHDMLCSAAGVQMIRDDISAGTTHITIAGCSQRAKVDAFHFPEAAMSRANLREGVLWLRPDTEENAETTQEMANDYMRMACAEVRFMKVPSPSGHQELSRSLLVVGGGVTGMTAALESAAAGYTVHIVEKASTLGGHAAQLVKRTPWRAAPAGAGKHDLPQAEDTGVPNLIASVEAEPRITVHLNSTVSRTSGAPGRFSADITIESGGTVTEKFGAIIQANGFVLYDANQLPEFGYGKTPDVVTNLELEKLVKDANLGPVGRPSDGKEVKSVAFVQCAGQRSTKPVHLPYCSGFCCTTSIKQAMYFKDQNPGCDTTVLFSDMRTPGAAGEDFYRTGQQAMVTFAKGQVSEVVPGGGQLKVKFKDLTLNEDTEMGCDLVVLATGMVANTGPDPYAQLGVEDAESEEDKEAALAKLLVASPSPSVLNLDYRQGTDLPQLKHGFVDSHFVCFPYETRRTGIYAAGPVRRPMDMKQAVDDAVGAAMKAIQAVENASAGAALHPRTGDLSYPQFRTEGCTQCKRCAVECPFGAVDEDEHRYPVFHESRCRRCGTCMGACPVRVISFENYSIDTIGQQIKAVDIPDAPSEKPRILAFACENDAYPALDMAAMAGEELTPFARIIPVRCLGSVSLSWVTDALNSGYDGIVLMGCRRGDDYQCHFVRGSAMATERLSTLSDTLTQLNLEAERVAVYEVAITDIKRAPRLINDMAATVAKIGMNPFKF